MDESEWPNSKSPLLVAGESSSSCGGVSASIDLMLWGASADLGRGEKDSISGSSESCLRVQDQLLVMIGTLSLREKLLRFTRSLDVCKASRSLGRNCDATDRMRLGPAIKDDSSHTETSALSQISLFHISTVPGPHPSLGSTTTSDSLEAIN